MLSMTILPKFNSARVLYYVNETSIQYFRDHTLFVQLHFPALHYVSASALHYASAPALHYASAPAFHYSASPDASMAQELKSHLRYH